MVIVFNANIMCFEFREVYLTGRFCVKSITKICKHIYLLQEMLANVDIVMIGSVFKSWSLLREGL